MRFCVAVTVGSGLGGLLRYGSSVAVQRWIGSDFPWGTFFVNVIGCGLLGFLAAWSVERGAWTPEARLFATTGFLGGFTTFSAFSHETLRLVEGGDWTRAGVNVAATLLCTMFSVWAGAAAARALP